MRTRENNVHGFALVLVLSLLALLVLLTYAVSSVSKVDGEIGMSAAYQTQARQNALLAMKVAIGDLQKNVGNDDVVTGMAGLAGVSSGKGNPTRQWCGIWGANGVLIKWLVSGGQSGAQPSIGSDSVQLVGVNSVGTDSTDRERTSVPRIAIENGHYAFWVGDNGAKLSVIIPDAYAAVVGKTTSIAAQFPTVALSSSDPTPVEYEQLRNAGATKAQIQGGFHSYALSHISFVSSQRKIGLLNVNSNSVRFLTGLWTTFVELNPSAADPAPKATTVAGAIADLASGPYQTVDDFITRISPYLVKKGVSVSEFEQTMGGWLTVRSQTFCIRAYGDAMNPADVSDSNATPESVAYCEAIVQRTDYDAPDAFGKKFVITYFRWLGPDDI